MPRRPPIATIKKIAGLAGVSIGTVDRVLHQRGRVSAETEAKIRRIVKDLKYKPNVFARNLKLAKTFVFGVLMPRPDQDSGYWALPLKGVGRAEADLLSQKIRIRRFFYDKHSAASINRALRKVLAAGLDGLLVAPVGTRRFEMFLKNLREQLPFVFFDSFIPNTDFLASIGQDSYQSGVLSARLMQMLINQPGHMAILNFMPKDYHIDDRARGFMTYCRRCPNITSGTYEVDDDKGQIGLGRVLDRIFLRHPDIRGIFVTSANTHPAAAYIKSRSAGGKVHIIGYDLIDENVRCLREGVIDFLISQQPERQGYEGIIALFRHVVLKEPVLPKVMMQIDIVTSENVDYYRS